MALNSDYYGRGRGRQTPADRTAEANDYFAQRLHETAWTDASDTDREKGPDCRPRDHRRPELQGSQAQRLYALWLLRYDPALPRKTFGPPRRASRWSSRRGEDEEVPEAIRIAEYEIAYALLMAKTRNWSWKPGKSAMGYGAVKTTYERSQLPIEHIINMVPSSVAWRLLRPFLRDSDALKIVTIELGECPGFLSPAPSPGQTPPRPNRWTVCYLFIRVEECSHVSVLVSSWVSCFEGEGGAGDGAGAGAGAVRGRSCRCGGWRERGLRQPVRRDLRRKT